MCESDSHFGHEGSCFVTVTRLLFVVDLHQPLPANSTSRATLRVNVNLELTLCPNPKQVFAELSGTPQYMTIPSLLGDSSTTCTFMYVDYIF